nr:unnamed protein product [Callosobruchus analis]
MSLNDEEEFQRSNVCHICEQPFLNGEKKVRDHDHLVPLNNYRGAAHEGCNINFKDNHTIPVVFHNLSGYDAHFIIKDIVLGMNGRVDLLPITKESYIAFTKNISDSLVSFRFIDSFKFMNSSLDKLSSYLTEYPILKSELLQYTEEHIKLLTKKGVYPYNFTDSIDKFSYPHLPSQESGKDPPAVAETDPSDSDVSIHSQSSTTSSAKTKSHNQPLITTSFSNILSFSVTTDNGKNIVKAVTELYGKNKHVPCFAHTLDLIVTKVVDETSGLSDVVNKVKVIVKFFKQSVVAADNLRKIQKLNSEEIFKLIQSVPTRWNSTFYMLQRFLRHSDMIAAALLKSPTSPPMVCASEIEMLTEICKILQPIEEVSKEMSGDTYVTSSKVIPIVNCLLKNIEKNSLATETSNNIKSLLISEISRRFGACEQNKLFAVATILDPRFKKCILGIHFHVLKQ